MGTFTAREWEMNVRGDEDVVIQCGGCDEKGLVIISLVKTVIITGDHSPQCGLSMISGTGREICGVISIRIICRLIVD